MRLKAILAIIAIAMLAPAAAHAQVEKPSLGARVRHYVRTHKELLAADGLIAGAWGADAGSSITCQQTSPRGCGETNPLLGRHPSAGATIGYMAGAATIQIVCNHLIWHFAPDHLTQRLIWMPTAATAIAEAFNVKNNVTAIEYLENPKNRLARLKEARARVMR